MGFTFSGPEPKLDSTVGGLFVRNNKLRWNSLSSSEGSALEQTDPTAPLCLNFCTLSEGVIRAAESECSNNWNRLRCCFYCNVILVTAAKDVVGLCCFEMIVPYVIMNRESGDIRRFTLSFC
jgi:hypothetical protein